MREDDIVGGTTLPRSDSGGLQITTLRRLSCEEYFITAIPVAGDAAETVFEKLAEVIRQKKAQIISQEVFGLSDQTGAGRRAIKKAFGEIDWPLTWIEDGSEDINGLTGGTQVWAVSGASVEPLRVGDMIVGRIFEDDHIRYCHLGGIRPAQASGTRQEQARETFEKMDQALDQAGMNFSQVLRTWFYNDDILSWYEDFNKVRNAYFTEKDLYSGLVPASTGIGGRNPSGTALIAALLAAEPKAKEVCAFAVPSPLQCAALNYGSSFSRAVEVALPDHRRLMVSGTASIAPDGKTMYVKDMSSQVEQTMRVVAAILESRRMSWSDVVHGVAYIKNVSKASAYGQYLKSHSLSALPVVVNHNTICRDDLLFEIEVNAVQRT